MTTIYERAGGFARIHQLVIDLFREVRRNPQLSKYFEGTDMPRLINHQTQFIIQMMDGPATPVTNEQISKAHKRLGIDETGFFAMVDLMQKIMRDFGLNDDDIHEVENRILTHKRYIVSG